MTSSVGQTSTETEPVGSPTSSGTSPISSGDIAYRVGVQHGVAMLGVLFGTLLV
jgi:hypothetical protein